MLAFAGVAPERFGLFRSVMVWEVHSALTGLSSGRRTISRAYRLVSA